MSGINERIMKIMSLALEISPADMEQKEGNPHVFVYYSPHCCALEVEVYLNGWGEEKKADYEVLFYNSIDNACEEADKIIDYLENLKKEVCKNGNIV